MGKRKSYRKTVWDIFIDPKYGVVYQTDSKKGIKFYAHTHSHDASGAITDIDLVEVDLDEKV